MVPYKDTGKCSFENKATGTYLCSLPLSTEPRDIEILKFVDCYILEHSYQRK